MTETARDYILEGVFNAQDAGKTDEEIKNALEDVLDMFVEDHNESE